MKLVTAVIGFILSLHFSLQASAACDTKDAVEKLVGIEEVSTELANIFQAYPEYSVFSQELTQLQVEATSFRQFAEANPDLSCKDLVPHGEVVPAQYSKMKKSYAVTGADSVQGLSMKFRALEILEMEFEMFLLMPINR